jgi:Uma2 family endonuclease
MRLLEEFEGQTPGVELLDNATVILGEANELQPDLCLRVLRAFGGQSLESKADYVEGAPEIVAEIAHSSRAIDLHSKRHEYEKAGVREYLVLTVEERQTYWFDFAAQSMIEPDRRGIARSRAFPGLWIHVAALLSGDREGMFEAITHGLRSAGHRPFVRKLQTTRQRFSESTGQGRGD